MVRSLVIGAGGFPEVFTDEEAMARGVEPFDPLPSVAHAVEDVARALHGAGVQAGLPLLDPTRDEMRGAWRTALDEAAGQPLVVHFSGHGEHDRGVLYLAVRGSERGRRLRATSVDVDELLKDAEDGDAPVLFLLDVCEAGQAVTGQFVRELLLRAGGRGADARNTWVIGACSAGETTRQARFSRATAAVLRRLAGAGLTCHRHCGTYRSRRSRRRLPGSWRATVGWASPWCVRWTNAPWTRCPGSSPTRPTPPTLRAGFSHPSTSC